MNQRMTKADLLTKGKELQAQNEAYRTDVQNLKTENQLVKLKAKKLTSTVNSKEEKLKKSNDKVGLLSRVSKELEDKRHELLETIASLEKREFNKDAELQELRKELVLVNDSLKEFRNKIKTNIKSFKSLGIKTLIGFVAIASLSMVLSFLFIDGLSFSERFMNAVVHTIPSLGVIFYLLHRD